MSKLQDQANKLKTDVPAIFLALKERRSGKWFMVVMGIFSQIGPLLIYFVARFGGKAVITRFEGAVLVAGYVAYTTYLVMNA